MPMPHPWPGKDVLGIAGADLFHHQARLRVACVRQGGVRAGVRSALPLLRVGGEGRWRCAAKDRAMLLWGCTARNPGQYVRTGTSGTVAAVESPISGSPTQRRDESSGQAGSGPSRRQHPASPGAATASSSTPSSSRKHHARILPASDPAEHGRSDKRARTGLNGGATEPWGGLSPPHACPPLPSHPCRKHGKHDPAICSPITIHPSIQHTNTQHCLCAESAMGRLTTPPRRRPRCWTPLLSGDRGAWHPSAR